MRTHLKRTATLCCACALALGAASQIKAEAYTEGFVKDGPLSIALTGRYASGGFNVDGGVMEIVAYNAANKYAYAVNGQSGKLAVIPMKNPGNERSVAKLSGIEFDVKAAVAAADSSFTYGDMTSVAVSPDGSTLAVALQAEDYSAPGRAAFFACRQDGTLAFKGMAATGIQPDMVTFADNGTVLTADEGEPRQGYTSPAVDPKGSVTVIRLSDLDTDIIDFTGYDAPAARQSLVNGNVVLKKGAAPSVDLEPEYIAVLGSKAYISLQEANAIAVLDIASRKINGIWSVGFEDYGIIPVDIDKGDGAYASKTYPGLMGIRMPDGIKAFSANGKDYIVTANEGDSRDWGGYLNELEVGKGEASPEKNVPAGAVSDKVVYFMASDYDGLKSGTDYLFGGRTFTIFEAANTGLKEVFTSKNEFEAGTALYVPDYFNTSNDNAKKDNRSGKKGPEPENVTVGMVDGKNYAFVALERPGGIMVYDITEPAKAFFINYINTRDFTETVPGSVDEDKFVTGGDVAPEGLEFVSGEFSPTGQPLLLAACEVSGTVAVYQLKSGN